MDPSHVRSRLASLAFVAFALVGCSGASSFGSLTALEPRSGGGAFAIGEDDEYDGLSERDDRNYVSVEIDGSGQLLGRKSASAPTAKPASSPVFDDGTTLDLIASPMEFGPLTVRGLDPQGNELWRTTVPIASLTVFCEDTGGVSGHGALILGGPTADPTDGAASSSGTSVLALTDDGSTIWERAITQQ